MILCKSPPSSQPQETSVQFFLNGLLYVRNNPSTSKDKLEEEEEDPLTSHFMLEYVEDPQFFTATREKLIKHHSGEPLTLIINVSDRCQCWLESSITNTFSLKKTFLHRHSIWLNTNVQRWFVNLRWDITKPGVSQFGLRNIYFHHCTTKTGSYPVGGFL